MHAADRSSFADAKSGSANPTLVTGHQHSQQQRPDLGLLREEMQHQWFHSMNKSFGTMQIKPQSNRKAYWLCDKCPDSIPHIWEASIKKRSVGSGCPYCASRLVCKHNSLATKAPVVAMAWDYIKNTGRIPEHYHQFSNAIAHWKCWQCSHEWQARIKDRVQKKSGCHMCYVASGQQKPRRRLPSLTASKPAFLHQWHPTLNEEAGIEADELTLGSQKEAYWLCKNCFEGVPHVWKASPKTRRHSGCPFCAHRRVCACNSLRSKFPELAAEMDNADNVLTSAQVMSVSNVKVNWKSPERGTWTQEVRNRTQDAAHGILRYALRAKSNTGPRDECT